MPVSRLLNVDGKLWGAVTIFEKAGDFLRTHTHTDEDNHITVVVFGGVRCVGHPKHEGKVLKAQPGGMIANWTAGEPHGFVALEDGTTIIKLDKVRS